MVPTRMLSCFLLLAMCLTVSSQYPQFKYPETFGYSRAWDAGAQDRAFFGLVPRGFFSRSLDVAGEAFGALLIPTLLVLGFQAIWPRRSHITKRSTDGLGSAAPTPMDDLTEHLTNIYYAATESDECIQRIVCELGATTKSLKQDNKKLMISILGKAASKKYSKLFSRFQDGVNTADCKKIGCKLLD